MKNDLTSQRNMYDVLKDSERLRYEVPTGPGGLLSFLWRTILKERQIWLPQFDLFVAQYIQKARKMQSSPKIANYFNRSNIFREMSRSTMTFKVFVKAMQLIGISRLKITIELEGRGKTTIHTAAMQLNGEEGIRFEDLMEESDSDEKMAASINTGAIGGLVAPAAASSPTPNRQAF